MDGYGPLGYPGQDPNPEPRLRVAKACETCRRRKRKCDGNYPCSSCFKNNIECIYVLERPKRKQRDSELVSNLEDQVLALKDYVRKLEAACGQTNLPNFSPSTLDDDFGTSTVPEDDSQSSAINDVSSMMWRMNLHGSGETSFVGPSGSFCFPVSGHGIETQSTGLEAEESVQVLLDLFRQHINLVHHFVPPPVIETLKAPESLDGELLQASVLAAASLLADSQGQVYADRAEAIAMKCCRTIPSVVTIQALAILTWRELALENENNAWLYNSMAASLVVHLGLHVSSLENVMQIPIGPPSDIDKSVRVQTFWSVFLMDRISTSMLGRNCMIPWRRVRATPYLKACSNPTTEDTVFDAHCQMWFIHDRYMDKIYSFEFGELEHFERHQLLSEARDHHMNFFRQMGRDLELRKNNMNPHVILLHMVYNMSLLLIHRPYLREPKDSAAHQLSIRTNMTSAHALVRLIRQYNKEANLENAPFFAVHCVLTAAVSLLLNATSINPTIRSQSVHRFRVCVDALDKMKRWARARRGLLLLRELANRWKVVSALPMRHSVPLVAPTQETPQTDDNDLDWGMLFANLEEPLNLDTIDLSTPTGEWVFHESD
ncbi:Nudix hydrolase [Fusarium mexicanum]|uniref:Nudix hydrolase n=1 Tax=Fusarium mexicanum TaxID=751941 RepID=A0A8H5I665_9HYPO|nr:Nudix hydrolase [Fusarium mexicanum]